MFNVEELRANGFVGFEPLLGLNTDAVTSAGGVYVVLTDHVDSPRFLAVSCGGHFKRKDPTVIESVLRSKWVDGCSVVYIGKATSLRSRLRQYRDFGRGKPIGHWGGRYIWQLENCADLVVCWRATDDPRRVEQSMLAAFEHQYRRLPFANLTR